MGLFWPSIIYFSLPRKCEPLNQLTRNQVAWINWKASRKNGRQLEIKNEISYKIAAGLDSSKQIANRDLNRPFVDNSVQSKI
jgi:hypothetical protein